MRPSFASWSPWLATPTLQPVSVSSAPQGHTAQPLTYLKHAEVAPRANVAYKLNAMPPAPKPETPLGRKAMMLGLFFVFWLITSAFFMNLYIARYLS